MLISNKLQSILYIISRNLTFLIGGIKTILLTRLIEPKDFGILAISTSILTFFNILKDYGVSQTLINIDILNNEKIQSFQTFNLLITLFLVTLISLIGFPVSLIFSNNAYVTIFFILSVAFFFQSIQTVNLTLLIRESKFAYLSFIEITSSIIGLLVSVILAYSGYGYKSILYSVFIANVVSFLLIFFKLNFLFKFKFDKTIIKSELANTFIYFKYNLYNFTIQNFDIFLIGRVYGSEILGLYSRSLALTQYGTQGFRRPLQTLFLSRISKTKDSIESTLNSYKLFLVLLSVSVLPFFFILIFYSKQILFFLFGQKWMIANDSLIYYSISALILTLTTPFVVLLQVLYVKKISKIYFFITLFYVLVLFISTFMDFSFFLKISVILSTLHLCFLLFIFFNLNKLYLIIFVNIIFRFLVVCFSSIFLTIFTFKFINFSNYFLIEILFFLLLFSFFSFFIKEFRNLLVTYLKFN